MNQADPLTLPLTGTVLVEASAGTGKTFTIATLYLRLLIESQRSVDQILVVTFTEAATQELKERVRGRILEALSWLEKTDLDPLQDKDPALYALLSKASDCAEVSRFLVDQLARMDEAAIHTIHGFCKRTLEAFAFESGITFSTEFMSDDAELRRQGAADFWRARVATAPAEEVGWIREHWPEGPDSLLQDLGGTLASEDLELIPEATEGGVTEAEDEFARLLGEFEQAWSAGKDAVAAILADGTVIKHASYNKNIRQAAMDAGDQVAQLDALPDSLPKHFERLTPAMLTKQTKSGAKTPGHPIFELCERIQTLHAEITRLPRALFLRQAREAIRAAMEREKSRLRAMFFDDLLSRLDRALASPGGAAFAERIRARLPVALVDEFQDTDPAQARIFRAIYQGQPENCLLLCGDPKQAIYGFRGADIFAYMRAKRDTPQEMRFTLGTNWRSSSRMVRAFNRLFLAVQNPFLFDPEITYQEITASPRADKEPLQIEGVEPVPLEIRHLRITEDNETSRPKGLIRSGVAKAELAAYCAGRVAELLILADAGKATLGERALTSADIAVLVRSRAEGELVQEALRACGVGSVSLSEDSVYDSEDAEDMDLVLGAMAAPGDEPLLRAALATGLIGVDAPTLAALAEQEAEWEAVMARFMHYRDLWETRGFMAAFQELLDREGVPQRLLARPDGERRMTNVLQLAELLQVAAREHRGMAALLTWFRAQRAGTAVTRGSSEEDQLRLESDRGLVTVMTLHKSKGLEFPVVLMPFAWSYYQGSNKRKPPPVFHDRDSGDLRLDLGSADIERNHALAEVEALAEQLRLFYVGVTRAAKLCILGWGKVNGADGSGLAYLLHQDSTSTATKPKNRLKSLDDDGIRADLDQLASAAPNCILIGDVAQATGLRWLGGATEAVTLAPSALKVAVEQQPRWRVSSYSRLVAGRDAEKPDHDAVETPAGELVGELAVLADARADQAATPDPVFALPAGTRFGEFVHKLLEILDFTSADDNTLAPLIANLAARYGPLGHHDGTPGKDWTRDLATLVQRVLDTPLGDAGAPKLRAIACKDRLDELEFHLPVSLLSPAVLSTALARDAAYTGIADGLTFAEMRGLLRGFIDLIFRHKDRYYIVDYKSNRLGWTFDAYRHAGMAQAIRAHRYDLQYLLYTLALHRYLSQRLPDYDYDTHFGGVRYLFLRGMHPDHGATTGVWSDRPARATIERLDRLFATGQKEAA
ncbi:MULTISPECIES: exodeoxyribonuclease V subunit beta [Thiorhodovibrio]|uniref:exodeoxyribonuclease V subunit beta n=1 Tax=Thiorhodovibrio TaxID=61593 RepID=UPI001911CC92|nr:MULTISPECIES: exodeoxyribonuclease V subunit beta [Thiorhodovibrio]